MTFAAARVVASFVKYSPCALRAYLLRVPFRPADRRYGREGVVKYSNSVTASARARGLTTKTRAMITTTGGDPLCETCEKRDQYSQSG